jgi:hypothetical protein
MTASLGRDGGGGTGAGSGRNLQQDAGLAAWLALGTAAGALGVLLLGWLSGGEYPSASQDTGLPPMVPATAFSFVLLGLALPLARKAGLAKRRIAAALAFGALGAAGLAGAVQLAFPDVSVPGLVRVGEPIDCVALAALFMISVCVLLVGSGRRQLALVVALPTLSAVAGLTVLGWLDLEAGAALPGYARTSMLTEIFALALLVAVLLSADVPRNGEAELRAVEARRN